ncbi:MAG: redoxin domain-containing protein [Bdellovibrionia bacterium]
MFVFVLTIFSFTAPSLGASGSNIVGLNLLQNLKILESASKSEVVLSKDIDVQAKNIVFFWASWCDVCKAMLPQYEQDMLALEKCGIKLNYISVRDKIEKTRAAEADLKIRKKSLVDEKGFLGRTIGVRMLPTAVVINSDGVVEEAFEGSSAVKASVQQLKKSKGKSCE